MVIAKTQVPQGRYQEGEGEPSAGADEEKSELLVAGQSQGGVGLVARLGQEEPGKSGNPQSETENEGGAASFEEKQAVQSVAGRGHLENATGGEEDQDQVVGNEGTGHGDSQPWGKAGSPTDSGPVCRLTLKKWLNPTISGIPSAKMTTALE